MRISDWSSDVGSSDLTGQHQRRRRTSDLCREEVAASAGISPIWCMRIEQGRAASVSSHALARIAEALHLAPAERAHMFALAGRPDPAFESARSEERRVGKGCGSTVRSRWSPYQ